LPRPSFIDPNNETCAMNVRMAQRQAERIDAVLKGGELRSDFFRSAIENELEKREKRAALYREVEAEFERRLAAAE
jgi:metal-responsive CopG/Arc/MetJ family transcriptional regulator